MAGRLTDEPTPRATPGDWCAWVPAGTTIQELALPEAVPDLPFLDVMTGRRSSIGQLVTWPQVERLLWHACRTYEIRGLGRAGIPIENRVTPSAGGLHTVQVLCQMSNGDPAPRLYLPGRHAFALIHHRADLATQNREDVRAVASSGAGCTLRLIADFWKIEAAYENGESLIWRDAGVVCATLCFVAQWLGLKSNVLGFAGTGYLSAAGFPLDRFMAVGAVQISG